MLVNMCSPCFSPCGGGGYCSECVGAAACNPILCGSCLTGAVAPTVECVTPGQDTGIAGNPCITPCLIPNTNIPDNGITNLSDPCNPCSPTQCGTTTQPPCAYCNPDATSICGKPTTPQGGGSGAGTAGSAGGGKSGGGGSGSPCGSKLSQALNRFGASLASLFGGGKTVPAGAVVPGLKTTKAPNVMSSNTFLLVILIVGTLLLFIAFGHAPDSD